MPSKNLPTFERPAYSSELAKKENRAKFDELPGHLRHYIKRIVDHGDVKLAATEAQIAKHTKDAVDYDLVKAESHSEMLERGGITNDLLMAHLMDCLEAQQIKFDKKGNPLECKNHAVTIKTIELILKIKAGVYEKGGSGKQGSVIDLFENSNDKSSS